MNLDKNIVREFMSHINLISIIAGLIWFENNQPD